MGSLDQEVVYPGEQCKVEKERQAEVSVWRQTMTGLRQQVMATDCRAKCGGRA